MNALEDLLLEAYRQQNQGRLDAAEQGYRLVLAQDARNVHALNLLGILCLNSARAEEAVALISRALKVDSSDAEPHANLGLALKDLGRHDEAEAALRQSLRLQAHNPVALNNLGNVQAEQQRLDDAIASFRSALLVDARYVPALVNLSAALLAKGQVEGARAAAQRAVELDGGSPAPHNALGDALLKLARHEAAAASFSQALALHPDDLDARIGLSAALKELGDTARAESLLRDVVARRSDHAVAWNSLGVLLEQQGDAPAAASAFRSAIAANPRHANAHYQLAQLKGAHLSDDEIAATRAFHAQPDLHDELRAPLAFALACIHERAGDFAASMRYLAEGQAIKAKAQPYDDAQVADHHRRIAQAMPAGWAAAGRTTSTEFNVQPVFVLGMPRSGTSLAEQILSSHPQVAGAGEVSLMEDTIAEAARVTSRPFPECVALLDANQLDALGRFYMDQLQQRARAVRYIVDKTPMNFQYVGFITAILPCARIVHCRREPMDNCLSIFKLPFETAHTYAHDLQALGRYYRHYSALMQHWAQVAGGKMITLQYEDVVDDLPGQTRRLVQFLGLEPDARMLQFHQTERLVKTPSASQVRQPIYRDSVQAWRRYGDALRPLALALDADPGPTPLQGR